MNNILKKVLYHILAIQEKVLTCRLDKSLKGSYRNQTSKTIISSTEHMTLNTETIKNIELVRKNINDIIKNCTGEPQKLLDYIETTGTKIYKLPYADKILNAIGEEEGLICELKGLKALYLNVCVNSKLSLRTKPVFIMREGTIEPLYLMHHFYKWYSLKMNLPGFDYKTQQNFKKYMKNPNDMSIEALSLDEIINLKEAIARDKEATDFCLEIAKQTEGAKNVHKKISDGGANV